MELNEWPPELPEGGMPAHVELAFHEFLALGPDRRLSDLVSYYREHPELAPTTDLEELRFWFSTYGWHKRAEIADRKTNAAVQKQIVARHIDFRMERLEDAQRARNLGRKLIDATSEALDEALSSPGKVALSMLLQNTMSAMKLLEWAGKVDREDGEVQRAVEAEEVLKMMEGVLPDSINKAFQEEFEKLKNS